MNKQKFIELLREPGAITSEELSGLENVTRQYPYFQSAHLLLAKGSKIIKDPKTKERISSAAVYSTDRILLKKYISGDLIFLDSVDKPPINVNEVIPEKKARPLPDQSKKTTGKVTSTDQKKSTGKAAAASTPGQASQKTNFNADSIIDEIKDGLESYKEHRKHFEDYLRSDEEEKAVNAALDKVSVADTDDNAGQNDTAAEAEVASPPTDGVEEQTIDPPTEDDFNLTAIIDEIKKDHIEEEEDLPVAKADNVEEKPAAEADTSEEIATAAPEEEKPVYKSKIIISGSNRAKKNPVEEETKEHPSVNPSAVEAKSEAVTEEVAEPSPEPEETSGADAMLTTAEQEASADAEQPVDEGLVNREETSTPENEENLSPGALRKAKMKRLKMQRDIIDDFIDTSPQMPTPDRPKPGEQKEEGTKDLSADSQVAETEIVSENMAIIYKNQGKNQKAIDIYKKLILKFPQKEAYFAARIKDLK